MDSGSDFVEDDVHMLKPIFIHTGKCEVLKVFLKKLFGAILG